MLVVFSHLSNKATTFQSQCLLHSLQEVGRIVQKLVHILQLPNDTFALIQLLRHLAFVGHEVVHFFAH